MLCIKCTTIQELNARREVVLRGQCFALAHMMGQNCPRCSTLVWIDELIRTLSGCLMCDPAAHPGEYPGGAFLSVCVKCECIAFYTDHRQQVSNMSCSLLAHYSGNTPCLKCGMMKEIDQILWAFVMVPCDPLAHLPSRDWHHPQESEDEETEGENEPMEAEEEGDEVEQEEDEDVEQEEDEDAEQEEDVEEEEDEGVEEEEDEGFIDVDDGTINGIAWQEIEAELAEIERILSDEN